MPPGGPAPFPLPFALGNRGLATRPQPGNREAHQGVRQADTRAAKSEAEKGEGGHQLFSFLLLLQEKVGTGSWGKRGKGWAALSKLHLELKNEFWILNQSGSSHEFRFTPLLLLLEHFDQLTTTLFLAFLLDHLRKARWWVVQCAHDKRTWLNLENSALHLFWLLAVMGGLLSHHLVRVGFVRNAFPAFTFPLPLLLLSAPLHIGFDLSFESCGSPRRGGTTHRLPPDIYDDHCTSCLAIFVAEPPLLDSTGAARGRARARVRAGSEPGPGQGTRRS